jgi:hypothetical protein
MSCPWAPLDEDGNDMPVYVSVSIISRGPISVINPLRRHQGVVTRSLTLNKLAKGITQWGATVSISKYRLVPSTH